MVERKKKYSFLIFNVSTKLQSHTTHNIFSHHYICVLVRMSSKTCTKKLTTQSTFGSYYLKIRTKVVKNSKTYRNKQN